MTDLTVSSPTRVAILGDGPSGSTLAALLAKKGVDVAVFATGKRPELVVGESLIPSIIPIFQKLGIEEEVAAIGEFKKGGTFVWTDEAPIDLSFESVRGLLPEYSYNCPRPVLDEVIAGAAKRSGARWIEGKAGFRKGDSDSNEGEIVLDHESLQAIPDWEGKQPDLLVDATGRRRSFVKLLDIPAEEGPRKDAAYFAHYGGWEHEGPPGQITIGRLDMGGWCWRIPLRDCMSVGVVLNKETASMLGRTPAERLEAAIEGDARLGRTGAKRKRLTDVPAYTNYQLITTRGHGRGWVAAGDAFGFVDPMLSPGMWVAMHSGEMLAELIDAAPSSPNEWKERLLGYEKRMSHLLEAWQELVGYFYDGSVIASYYGGAQFMKKRPNPLSRLMEKHIQRNFAGMACGIYTERAYSRGLMRFICKYGTYGVSREEMAIS